MNDLLDLAISAHGGMERWNQLTRIDASVAIGGALWPSKGQGGVLDQVTVSVDCHDQRVAYAPFGAAGGRGVYRPEQVAIETGDGRLVKSRNDPRSSFQGHARETPWDDLQLLYFAGYAMWTYLTTPFLLATPGFESREIAPWEEDGAIWRRLEVDFPNHIASHNGKQVFYFDQTGILKRHDYNAEVLGGLPAANYASEPRSFGGLIWPTKRRVYARSSEGKPLRERLAVAIDFDDIIVS
jgi:hypothetical protein